MKKFIKLLFLSSMLIGGLSVTSCKDDNVVIEPDFDDSQENDYIEGATDLVNGDFVVFVDVDELPDTLLSLGTRKNIDITVDEPDRFPYHWEQIRDKEGNNHILLKGIVKELEIEPGDVEPFEFTISTKDGKLKDVCRVVLRRKNNIGAESDEEFYYQTIGKSMFPWSTWGYTYKQILSPNYSNLTLGQAGDDIHFEIGGTRYEETMEAFSAAVGLSFKGPKGKLGVNKAILSGGLELGISGECQTVLNYEYYMGLIGKVMGTALWKQASVVGGISKKEMGDYLDETTHRVFNKKRDPFYKQYTNDKEGVYKLLNEYGTHVIASATFGGIFVHTYYRIEGAYETSIGFDMSLDVKDTQKSENAIEEWVDIWKAKNANYVDVNASCSYDYSDYKKVSKGYGVDFARGGNTVTTDLATWDKAFTSDNKSGWKLTRYQVDNYDTENNLIPIYEFIKEPARRDSVTKYFEDYINDYVAREFPDKEEWHLVIADFLMKYDDHGGHNKGHGESFIGLGPDTKKYIYYPMMANPRFPISDDWGHPVETCQDNFIWLSVPGAHYWYYALGYHEDGTLGCTKVDFMENEDEYVDSHPDQWLQRGEYSASKGTGGTLKDNYVHLVIGDKETPVEDKVKAIALVEVEDDEVDASFYKNAFAVTGGTEWQYPWTDNTDFSNYWRSKQDYTHYLKSPAGWGDVLHYYYEHGNGAIIKHKFIPVWSTEPTPIQTKGMNFGIGASQGKIQHPFSWDTKLTN